VESISISNLVIQNGTINIAIGHGNQIDIYQLYLCQCVNGKCLSYQICECYIGWFGDTCEYPYFIIIISIIGVAAASFAFGKHIQKMNLKEAQLRNYSTLK